MASEIQDGTGEVTAEELVADLERRHEAARGAGGPERIARIHASGRLTARERIDRIFDPGSWYELGMLAEPELRREDVITTGDGVVTGLARLDGRKVCVIAVETTVLTGTTAPVNMRKQGRIAEWAGRKGLPLVCLSDNDGGRLPDLLGWRFSGVPFDFDTFLQSPPGCPAIPRISAAVGPSFGDAALHAAMANFVVMVKSAAVALSGPPVIRAAIGEEVTATELGGPAVAAEQSGSVHMVVDDEEAAFTAVKQFLSYMPDSAALPAPVADAVAPKRDPRKLLSVVPTASRRGYDMRRVLDSIFDADSVMPWGELYGRSVICALARLDGQPVGVVASQPMQRAGVMDVPALKKEAGFIDLCDTFNLPLVFLQDVPGLMIGSDAERAGILAGYEMVVGRLARATVPKVAVVVRKAYGGGHIALGGRPVHPDLLFAWPTADMGFMAPDTGVKTVYRRRLEEVLERDGQSAHDELTAELEAEWAAQERPWEAAANIILDDVIDPRRTREIVAQGIDYAWGSGPRVTAAGTGGRA
jgi:acetyl-CoA carboxylase carboxyltransferase component